MKLAFVLKVVMAQPFPISLLLACRFGRITVVEAAAVTKLLARDVERDARAGLPVRVPSVGDIRLEASGHVTWSHGREVPADRAGRRLARVLGVLVVEAERGGDRAPAALTFALARATDEQALVPLESLHDLHLIIDRLAPADPLPVTAAFAERAGSRATDVPPEAIITITDLRRARRDRGVSLATIAAETGIPLTLLRELEWGLFANWPAGPQTEASLRAYARAAGLPSEAVMTIVLGPSSHRSPLEVPRTPVWVVACAALVLSGAAAATWVSRESVPRAIEARPVHQMAHVAPAAPPPPQVVESAAGTPSRAAFDRRAQRASDKRVGARSQTSRVVRREQKRKADSSFWKRPLLIIRFGKE